MKLPLAIAEKLHLLAEGKRTSASELRYATVAEMIDEGVITEHITGRTKRVLYIPDKAAFGNYLYNKWTIADLGEYIQTVRNAEATRANLIQVANDSKATGRRTFKGFLVNTYMPLECSLNGSSFLLQPHAGTFRFIYDFESFIPAADVVIIGVENAENFASVDKQRYLFPDMKPLFVSRYPQGQSKDLTKWLLSIPNPYVHLGDYDFAGINIYLQEYEKHLGERASFFVPQNIEELIEKHGNKALYDQQQLNSSHEVGGELHELIALIHKHKKGLEQEALLIQP